MEINSAIKTILEENGINYQDGVTYLLCIYFDVYPSFIPEHIKRLVNSTKIVIVTEEDVTWEIPLFSSQVSTQYFDWVVTEYLEYFKEIGKGSHSRECIKRMKKFFATYPDVRKEEVLEATVMYLQNTNKNFVRHPHYFIFKGSGYSMTSDLYAWVETYREEIKTQTERSEERKLL